MSLPFRMIYLYSNHFVWFHTVHCFSIIIEMFPCNLNVFTQFKKFCIITDINVDVVMYNSRMSRYWPINPLITVFHRNFNDPILIIEYAHSAKEITFSKIDFIPETCININIM
jgi:hypothetical protein